MSFLLARNYDLRAIVMTIGILRSQDRGGIPHNPWLGGALNKTRHEEFREYVAARGPALLRAAMQLTSDRAEAEDLLQAALAKTYLAWDRINDRASVDGYVRRAMVNTQISWWRRKKLEIYPTDELPDQPVDDHTRRSEMHDALGRALDRLPARQRLAVVLRYYEDMPEAEIAEVLGVSVGTVKSTVSRAMARLRDDAGLGDEFPDVPTQRP
jgi:RNA polymerase sigma-70 factor (sigma-E family)